MRLQPLAIALFLALPLSANAASAPLPESHQQIPLPEQTTRRLTLPPGVGTSDRANPATAAQLAREAHVQPAEQSGLAMQGRGRPLPYSQATGMWQGAQDMPPAMPGDAAQATKPPSPLAAPGTSVTPPESASASVSLPARSQEEDIVFGTSQLEGSNFRSRGQVQYMRDPKTGDHITRVLPPRPTPQEEQTPLLIAPQIYPDMFGPYGPAYGPPHYGYRHGQRHFGPGHGPWRRPPRHPHYGGPR